MRRAVRAAAWNQATALARDLAQTFPNEDPSGLLPSRLKRFARTLDASARAGRVGTSFPNS